MVVIYRTALQLDFNLRKLRQLVSLPGGTAGTFRKSKICHDILSIRFFQVCDILPCLLTHSLSKPSGGRAGASILRANANDIGFQSHWHWRSIHTSLTFKVNAVENAQKPCLYRHVLAWLTRAS